MNNFICEWPSRFSQYPKIPAKKQKIPCKTPIFFKNEVSQKKFFSHFAKGFGPTCILVCTRGNIVYNGHMKKNRIARLSLLLASVFSLASCDLGAFIRILDSLSPDSAAYDNSREHLSIALEYEDGEHYTATPTALNYEDINDSNGNFPCRAYGDIKLLVIPVKIRGYDSVATETNIQKIRNAFFGNTEDTGWESVASFYKKSSYGALNLSGVVADQWFDCGYTTSQLAALTAPAGTKNMGSYDRTWTVLENAVSWYKQTYHDNCTQFDVDADGRIDGVWLVYGCPDHSKGSGLDQQLFWAYNFKDYSASDTPPVTNPIGYSYCWASYDFMENDQYGSAANKVDAHTYIHETGHLLGLEDYYVSRKEAGEENYGPMGALDMMDYNIIDHNAWSKYAYGWIKPYVVEDSCEITLKPSATSGQAIILPTTGGFNGSAFDEFIMMEYYTPDLLNYQDSYVGYGEYPHGFTDNGVRIYHVDARFATKTVLDQQGRYDDTLDNGEVGLVVASNSSGTNKTNLNNYLKGESNPPANFLKFRLIQELDCTQKRNFDTAKQVKNGKEVGVWADNSTLFKNNNTFSFEEYKESFPNYVNGGSMTMNDGTSLPWSVSFSESSDTSIKVSITKLS